MATYSGEGYSGSIKVISHGTNLIEVMSAHFTDAMSVFPLRPTYCGKGASFKHRTAEPFQVGYIHRGFYAQETHLFRVDEEEEKLWYVDPITTNQLTLARRTSCYGDLSIAAAPCYVISTDHEFRRAKMALSSNLVVDIVTEM